jgi:hypothetical protein
VAAVDLLYERFHLARVGALALESDEIELDRTIPEFDHGVPFPGSQR